MTTVQAIAGLGGYPASPLRQLVERIERELGLYVTKSDWKDADDVDADILLCHSFGVDTGYLQIMASERPRTLVWVDGVRWTQLNMLPKDIERRSKPLSGFVRQPFALPAYITRAVAFLREPDFAGSYAPPIHSEILFADDEHRNVFVPGVWHNAIVNTEPVWDEVCLQIAK